MNKKVGVAGLILCLAAIYVAFLFTRTTPFLEDKKIVAAADLFNEHGELNSTLPIVLDFTAIWCKPCQKMAPELEAEKKLWNGKIKFIAVDVDMDRWELAKHFDIQGVPALVVLSPKSKQANVHMGFMDQSLIHRFIEASLR